jgi:hypothetical protein
MLWTMLLKGKDCRVVSGSDWTGVIESVSDEGVEVSYEDRYGTEQSVLRPSVYVYIYSPSYMTVFDFIEACKKDLQS